MAAALTRIFSDLHYGDRASRIRSLAQLRPLLAGVDHLVLNGDTLDMRPGPSPAHTARCRDEVLAFFPTHTSHVTFLTGNHDADFSPHHALDLADGAVFATHGDIFYDDIVPWSQDAPAIRKKITAALAALPAAERPLLSARFAVWRQVAAEIPQRHQSERRWLRFAFYFIRDTVWPPDRMWRVIRTWRDAPNCAAAFARTHRPQAKAIITGHTHRPGVWRTSAGVTVINTGSFCRPLGCCIVDLADGRGIVRNMVERGGEFRLGAPLAEFSLADA